MRPISVTQSGAGSSAPIMLDIHGRPEVSLQANVTGTVNYDVEQTLDDPASGSAVWFDHPDSNLVGATASKQGNYGYIPRAVRLTINSGGGSVTLTVIQSGITG